MGVDVRKSRAVVLFLGWRSSPVPLRDSQRLVDEYGASDGAVLERYVNEVIDELHSLEVDWSVDTLTSAAAKAVRLVSDRHPELSSDALEALQWKFTYDWR